MSKTKKQLNKLPKNMKTTTEGHCPYCHKPVKAVENHIHDCHKGEKIPIKKKLVSLFSKYF